MTHPEANSHKHHNADKGAHLLTQEFAGLTASEMVRSTHQRFGSHAYMLSSFGVDAGIMVKLLHQAAVPITVLTIDTGFLFPATIEYRQSLQEKYGFALQIYEPPDEHVIKIFEEQLWSADIETYNRLTKIEPLVRAVRELRIEALLGGIRAYQTQNRASKRLVERASTGEYRIHPILHWTSQQVDEFLYDVPRHPLESQGYESVGDWTTTVAGNGRSGRRLGLTMECGINILNKS